MLMIALVVSLASSAAHADVVCSWHAPVWQVCSADSRGGDKVVTPASPGTPSGPPGGGDPPDGPGNSDGGHSHGHDHGHGKK